MERLLSLWVILSLVVGAVLGISSIHAEIFLNKKKRMYLALKKKNLR